MTCKETLNLLKRRGLKENKTTGSKCNMFLQEGK